ncbi:MAG TPA: GNAT family N-acetyltransferase [Longimicrobium sp.]|nr:GNAT family N-acetyltransferase [Longimicrobium sp.]
MTVRRLAPADAEAFRALRLRGLRESPEAFGSTYEEEVDRPLQATVDVLAGATGSAVFGALDDDGTLLGIGGVHRESKRKAMHRAGIWGMYVVPEARGRGLGRALLAALVDHARGLEGLHRLELGVTTTNTAARGLYVAFGFIPYGVQPDAYRSDGRSWDTELMTMALDGA